MVEFVSFRLGGFLLYFHRTPNPKKLFFGGSTLALSIYPFTFLTCQLGHCLEAEKERRKLHRFQEQHFVSDVVPQRDHH